MSESHNDPFYVGYLELPATLRSAVMGFIGLGAAVAVIVAFLASSEQKDPGNGVWDLDKLYEIEGYLEVAPYPLLHVADEKSKVGSRAVLLVGSLKFGVEDRTKDLAGSNVRVRGEFIARGGRAMFAVLDDADAIVKVTGDAKAPPKEQLGEHTMVGEICDSKCFLGVMKPGSGKPHRGCAVRCIADGIPPIFVTRDDRGTPTVYLLTNSELGAANAPVLPFVAEPVRLTGRLERHGDMLVFAADTHKIERL